jgi:flagellar hook-length control protein FliK
MVQQITMPAAVPAKAKPEKADGGKSDSGFESLLQLAAGGLKAKKADAPEPEKTEEPEKSQDSPSSAQTAAAGLFPMFWAAAQLSGDLPAPGGQGSLSVSGVLPAAGAAAAPAEAAGLLSAQLSGRADGAPSAQPAGQAAQALSGGKSQALPVQLPGEPAQGTQDASGQTAVLNPQSGAAVPAGQQAASGTVPLQAGILTRGATNVPGTAQASDVQAPEAQTAAGKQESARETAAPESAAAAQERAELPVWRESSDLEQKAGLSGERDGSSEQTNAEPAKEQAVLPFQQLVQDSGFVPKVSGRAKAASGTAFRQVSDQVQLHYRQGESRFQMDLYPRDLGRISVKMALEGGKLLVEIAADNPRTQSMLVSGSGEIRSLLESAVGQPVQVSEPAPETPYYEQQQDQSSRQPGQQQRQQHEAENSETASTDDFLSVIQELRNKGAAIERV